MQPSWISVPWLQFQQLGAPGLPPAAQMMSAAPPHYQHLNGFTSLSSAPGLTSGPHGLSSAGGPHGLSTHGTHGLSSASHGMATGGPHALSGINTSMSGLNPANVAGGLTVSMANLTPSQPTMTQQAVAMNGLPTTMSNLTSMNGSINVLSASMNGLSGSINGLHGMHGCLTAVPNGVHHHHHPHGSHLAGLNLTGLGGLGGMAGMGGLMALHPHSGGPPPPHPQALLHLRPRQPAPPPLAALLAAKKDPDFGLGFKREKRKAEDDLADNQDIKKRPWAAAPTADPRGGGYSLVTHDPLYTTHHQWGGMMTPPPPRYRGEAWPQPSASLPAKLETKALKAKRPGFSEERYNETSYFIENGLRKVYPYYFTFTTFTKGRWVGEKILDVFAKEFRAHPAEEYERCIKSGTLTVNYERVETDCRLKHNDLLANIVHRHETPVLARSIEVMHLDEELVVLDKPCSLPVHPCGRYRHNTVVFILAKEYNLKNLRTIHRLDRLTSGLLLFGRTPKKAREMEQQIRTRQVTKQYVCRVEGRFPNGLIECNEPIEVVSYKIGVCKVSPSGKDCKTEFQLLSYNGTSSVVLCKPRTGRMHQIRVHLQFLGYPIVNDPLYNHVVFGPNKGKGGVTDKTDDQLIQDLIKIHNAENWLGMDGDVEYSMFKGPAKEDGTDEEGGSLRNTPSPKDKVGSPSTPGNGASPPTPSPPALQSPDTPIAGVVSCPASPKLLPGTNSEVCRDDYGFKPHMKTVDKNCYECKVRYRDPKPKDLVMFLHALKYSGPGWQFETKMPDWAAPDWMDTKEQ